MAERRRVRVRGDGSTGGGPPRHTDPGLEWRKLAGVLIEARPPDWAVIGIGVNISIDPTTLPDDLRWPAASVGHGVEPDQALAAVCERLASWVDAPAELLHPEFGGVTCWPGAGSAGRARGARLGRGAGLPTGSTSAETWPS